MPLPEHNPVFNLARGAATATAPPPYSFQGVTMRVFPLAADFQSLARFCDQYLNLAQDFAFFRPSMPYVMCCVIDYGRMSLQAGNLGWTSQNEVLFSVPLEWYVRQDGRWQFRDLAQVSPFIFVDNESSQVVGREVFGWPKVQGWFARDIDPWASHPRNRRRLLRLETRVFERLYVGDRPVPRELLVIEEEPPPSFTLFPPQPDSPLNPVVALPKALLGWSTLVTQSVEAWARITLQGSSSLERRTLPDLVSGLLRSLGSFAGSLHANTLNLKQFRDAAQPSEACYQALTNARIEITQLHSAGMLGDLAMLGGDPSGGFRIGLHRYDSLPILETLGLTIHDESEADGGRLATLKPVLPFWMELDLRYLAGENLCWRTKAQPWCNQRHEQLSPVPDASAQRPEAIPYNTTGASGFQVASGPFRFPGTTLRVLPLLADPERLNALCDAYLNRDPDSGRPNDVARFRPWGRYVYLIIKTFSAMSSETDDVGLWADKQIDFAIPVRWYDRTGPDGRERLASVGLFSPFMFSSGDLEATTLREVNGWETVEATIESPPNTWLADAGPVADLTPLMRLHTDVFCALGEGLKSQWRTLFEVLKGDVIGWRAFSDWNQVAEGAGQATKRELESMSRRAGSEDFTKLRALAIELLGNDAPWNQFSLKQFRDAAAPTEACYQALVRSRTVIERIHDLREIEARIHVAIHRYPTQPIVDLLGLVVKSRKITEDGVVECLQPSRPFYMKVDLRTEAGENIAWRAGSTRWQCPTPAARARDRASYFLTPGRKTVGEELIDQIDHRPQRIRDSLRSWQENEGANLGLDCVEAARVVESELEPQMVVHATLSREWEHWGNPRWFQRRDAGPPYQLPLFVLRRDSVGTAADALFPGCVPDDPDYWTPSLEVPERSDATEPDDDET